jgi:chaperonin cofactor prefoldin
MTEQEIVLEELRKENEKLKRRVNTLEDELWRLEKRLKKAEEVRPQRFIFGGSKTGERKKKP